MSKQDKTGEPGKKWPDPVFDAEDTNIRKPPKEGALPLPHERDEAPQKDEPGVHEHREHREIIEQASRDIGRGLRDTDQHGIPSDVPGPGADPERSPGADVPPEGVDVAHPPRQKRHGK